MKKIFSCFSKYRRNAMLAPLCKLAESLLELTIPLLVANIIDVGLENSNLPYIGKMLLLMATIGFVGLAFSLAGQYFSAKVATGYTADIRAALFEKTVRLPFSGRDKQGIATLLTRLTSDCNQVQTGVNLTLRLLLRSPFVVFGAWIMAATIDPSLSVVFCIAVPLLFLIVFGILIFTMPKYRANQNALDGVASSTRENLVGVRVIRAFGVEERFVSDYHQKTERLYRGQTKVAKISALLNPLTYAVVSAAIIAILYFGGVRVNSGTLTQGQVIAMYQYMGQILVELVKLANLIVTVSKSLVCAKRISAVLENDGAYPTTSSFAEEGSYIQFQNVSMRYGGAGKEALSNVNFSVNKGETIGIIGGTGSGKSTLVSLLARFYDVTEGSLRLEGKDVRSLPVSELRSRLGFVLQKAELFKGTIRENVCFGNSSVTDEEIWQALTLAQAKEIVEEKGGLDALVEQRGKNFSGGQRQRLSIARALVKKPEILVLDDSASALDYATESALRKALRNLPFIATTFIVSQRTASMRYADKIVVLDQGRMVACDKHENLLRNCSIYAEIYRSQVAGGEENA
ncbi:MAG: ABC transporter ATP-binding protein [Clostridia bacterium]|nr:ABC transporter ATP-binding protein [Clostridia bacterium]